MPRSTARDGRRTTARREADHARRRVQTGLAAHRRSRRSAAVEAARPRSRDGGDVPASGQVDCQVAARNAITRSPEPHANSFGVEPAASRAQAQHVGRRRRTLRESSVARSDGSPRATRRRLRRPEPGRPPARSARPSLDGRGSWPVRRARPQRTLTEPSAAIARERDRRRGRRAATTPLLRGERAARIAHRGVDTPPTRRGGRRSRRSRAPSDHEPPARGSVLVRKSPRPGRYRTLREHRSATGGRAARRDAQRPARRSRSPSSQAARPPPSSSCGEPHDLRGRPSMPKRSPARRWCRDSARMSVVARLPSTANAAPWLVAMRSLFDAGVAIAERRLGMAASRRGAPRAGAARSAASRGSSEHSQSVAHARTLSGGVRSARAAARAREVAVGGLDELHHVAAAGRGADGDAQRLVAVTSSTGSVVSTSSTSRSASRRAVAPGTQTPNSSPPRRPAIPWRDGTRAISARTSRRRVAVVGLTAFTRRRRRSAPCPRRRRRVRGGRCRARSGGWRPVRSLVCAMASRRPTASASSPPPGRGDAGAFGDLVHSSGPASAARARSQQRTVDLVAGEQVRDGVGDLDARRLVGRAASRVGPPWW